MRGLKGRKRTVLLALDETILTKTPPLRIAWDKRGQQISILVTGNRGKCILYGTLNLRSGQVELAISRHWTQEDFQAFLHQIRRRWWGWRIVLFLDRGSSHRAQRSREVARALGFELRWLQCTEFHLLSSSIASCSNERFP